MADDASLNYPYLFRPLSLRMAQMTSQCLRPTLYNLIVSVLHAEIEVAHSEGRIASVVTVESGHSIGTSLAVLRMFHRLGARSLTLTHNCNTPW